MHPAICLRTSNLSPCPQSSPRCFHFFEFPMPFTLRRSWADVRHSRCMSCPCASRSSNFYIREASRRGHGHVQRTTTNLAMVLSAGSEREHRWPSTREHMQLGSRSPIPPHPQPPFPPNPNLASMKRNQGYIPDPTFLETSERQSKVFGWGRFKGIACGSSALLPDHHR